MKDFIWGLMLVIAGIAISIYFKEIIDMLKGF